MKTTLTIDERLMERLQAEALRRGATPSDVAEVALRLFLYAPPRPPSDLPPLPVFDGGRFLVDVADREALSDLP